MKAAQVRANGYDQVSRVTTSGGNSNAVLSHCGIGIGAIIGCTHT